MFVIILLQLHGIFVIETAEVYGNSFFVQERGVFLISGGGFTTFL